MENSNSVKDQASKIQRSSNLIKAFMVLVAVVQVVRFYQSHVIDFGDVAGSVGGLSLMRGILLSPKILAIPVKLWRTSTDVFSPASYKYFIVAIVLIVVSGF